MSIRADRLFIPSDWKRWIAVNLLGGSPPDELKNILVREGFEEELARLEVDTAANHPYLEAGRSYARKTAKRDWVLHTQRISQREFWPAEVEHRSGLTGEEFRERYCGCNRPVIVTDAISHWPALSLWNEDYLRQRGQGCAVQIQANRESNPDYEESKDRHRSSCEFGEFISRVFQGGTSNDVYMTASNSSANKEILSRLSDDFEAPEPYADASTGGGRTFLWIGPKGTFTPLHHDLTNNFMAQVHGRKRVRLISPANLPLVYNNRHCFSDLRIDEIDSQKHPLFRDVQIYNVILEPGELLFLPVGWWHDVLALDVSITITMTNIYGTNDFTAFYQTQGEI
ncbi:cupin-like domain-containing protein [bacterium]|nr:cupin-like domain-containing protein [bacterium]